MATATASPRDSKIRSETGSYLAPIEKPKGLMLKLLYWFHGAEAVARQALLWSRVDLTARRALVNGAAGLVSLRNGQPFSVGAITVRGGRIVEIDILADPERLSRLDLTVLDR
jgi:hypothetical protein